MFHPTIFDNLKIVLEGAVYDRDFEGAITVIGRSDLVDLATYQRTFQIDFCLAEQEALNHLQRITAQMQLRSTLADIASEQLEQPITEPVGCTICVHFLLSIGEVLGNSVRITAELNDIWGNRPQISQLVMASFTEHHIAWPAERYQTKVTLDFQRKIDEGNIEDMRDLLEHCIHSLIRIQALNLA